MHNLLLDMYILSLSIFVILCRIRKYGNSRKPATRQLGFKPVIPVLKCKIKSLQFVNQRMHIQFHIKHFKNTLKHSHMFRSCQIIIRELSSLLKLYYSIHNSIGICKRGVVAAYHVVYECVVEQWLGVRPMHKPKEVMGINI